MARLARHAGEKRSLWGRIKDVALTDVGVLVRGLDEGSLERIEELLLEADFGVPSTLRLVDRIESISRSGKIRTEGEFHAALEAELLALLEGKERGLARAVEGPTVYLFVGVNGVGKTTTLAKLAHRLKGEGARPLLAAADTFRAGAIDQLRIWSERVGAGFIGARPGGDPAAVAFDAVDAAVARDHDVVLVDTAGRLHTQQDLMAELAKVERVVGRRVEGAPHETILVLDATVGQNAVAQARTFAGALRVTGFALAKLDSTSRGGIVVALEQDLGIPVKLVGTGERPEDLEPFRPGAFVEGVLAP